MKASLERTHTHTRGSGNIFQKPCSWGNSCLCSDVRSRRRKLQSPGLRCEGMSALTSAKSQEPESTTANGPSAAIRDNRDVHSQREPNSSHLQTHFIFITHPLILFPLLGFDASSTKIKLSRNERKRLNNLSSDLNSVYHSWM